MLNLSSDDRKQLRTAIELAYPRPNDFRVFVDEELNQNLALISTADSHRTVIFDFIKWSISKGYIDDLILALAKDTENPDIQQFCGRVLQQRFKLNVLEARSITAPLDVEPADWDLDIHDEALQSFLPQKLFSVQADVGTLQRGLELANAVCKITFSDRPAEESGTGVLIAPDLVLTNYHVFSRDATLDLNEIAQSARFEFGHISRPFGEAARTQILPAAAGKPVVACSPVQQLDYVLVRLGVAEDWTITPVPFDALASIMPRSPLSILQHPEGEKMKVDLSNSGVVKINEAKGLVFYVNQAKGGSSGSPCFDQDWQLVALHRSEISTSFGSVRKGILFSAIYPQISSFL
jgi:endonuclease G, mitochondrial